MDVSIFFSTEKFVIVDNFVCADCYVFQEGIEFSPQT